MTETYPIMNAFPMWKRHTLAQQKFIDNKAYELARKKCDKLIESIVDDYGIDHPVYFKSVLENLCEHSQDLIKSSIFGDMADIYREIFYRMPFDQLEGFIANLN